MLYKEDIVLAASCICSLAATLLWFEFMNPLAIIFTGVGLIMLGIWIYLVFVIE